jgi:hypothetical protein
MLRSWQPASLVGLMLLTSGCGSGGGLVPVGGKVTVNDVPLRNASVQFIPTGDTPGNQRGAGWTDENGEFTLTNRQGKPGLEPGTYKVVISKMVMPDGSDYDPKAGVAPMDSPARERLPANCSDPEKTDQKATITTENKPQLFSLTVPGWK